jgi:hypothetical protein
MAVITMLNKRRFIIPSQERDIVRHVLLAVSVSNRGYGGCGTNLMAFVKNRMK